MAGITLREYIREIEKQIDGKRYDEAIAHCQYILQTYPKAVEIYRLLGKAFLESQRYGDAADIFQRVLSAIPDDFVSHAGMSIIREDEGNLDEGIWHMERAFDSQPANSALQEELRRMYGRRDNVEPPKIRLTRSALARMYCKGELYPQAVAETRAALAESPDRLDLLALLAEIYWRSGQKAEAVEAAARLVRKLPYCIVANRVLYETLRGAERDGEAQTCLQRLNQVEPYSAFVSDTYPTPESVPDSLIRIDKLEWKVGQTQAGKSGQPSWAASLGVDLYEMSPGGENQIPDWLGAPANSDEDAPAFSLASNSAMDIDFSWDETSAAVEGDDAVESDLELDASPEGEALPDWLKDLGWKPASAESREAEAGYQPDEDFGAQVMDAGVPAADAGTIEPNLAAAEMPDWLNELAPEKTDEDAGGDENLSPWLDNLFAQQQAEPPTAEGAQAFEAADEPSGEDLYGWMAAGAAAGAAAGMTAGALRNAAEPASEEMPDQPPAAGAGAEAPAWLRDVEGFAVDFSTPDEAEDADASEWESEAGGGQEQELPAWLLQEETQPAESAAPGQEAPASTTPAWLLDETGGEDAAEAPAASSAGLPGWLFESESTPAEPPAAQEGDLPAWLLETGPAEAQPAAQDSGEELPGWLVGAGEPEAQPAPAEGADSEALPEWLRADDAWEEPGKEGPALQEPAVAEPAAEPVESEEIPSWLLEFGEAAAEPAQPQEPEPAAEEPAGGETTPAWLLELQAVEEETLPGAMSDAIGEVERADEDALPEWLREEPVAAEAAETPIDEIPEWLRTGALAAAAGDAADWLAVEPPEPGSEPSPAPTPAPQETPELAEAFAWLARMMTPLEPEETIPAGTVEAVIEIQETPPETRPEPDEIEALDLDAQRLETPVETLELGTAELDALLAKLPVEATEAEVTEAEPAEVEATGPGALLFEAPAETAAEPFEIEEPPAAGFPGMETTAGTEPGVQTFAAAPEAAPAETFDFPLDGDDAFAWLESLAVKQGAQEALLLTPEERAEKPPEWVQQAAVEAAEETVQEAEVAEEAPEMSGAETPEPAAEDDQAQDELSPREPVAEADLDLPKTAELKSPTGPAPQPQAAESEPAEEESPWAAVETASPAPAAEEDLDEVASPFIEDESIEDEPPPAPQAAVELQATEYLLDDVQSAPTEKLGAAPPAAPAAHPEPESETERIPPGAGREAPAPPPTPPDAPELPAWLAGVETESRDEVVEWRPPTFTRRRYDLNLASLVELERLPGIGFIMAQRIVNHRETNGPFQRVEDLLQVPEFSPYTLEIIRDNLFVIPSTSRPVRSEPVSARPSTRRKVTPPAPEAPAPEAPAEPVSSGRRSQRPAAPPPERPAAPEPAPALQDAEAPAEIQEARSLTEQEDWPAAHAAYDRLIQSGQHLEWVIRDLNSASLTRPEDIEIWQSLGDAYMRANRLKEAMQSYSQAEKLLR